MGAFASPAMNQPLPSDAERQRIRELSRYYCTFRQPNSTPDAIPSSAPPADLPSLSKDITLNALTQLALYRFGCDRSFVSLIDGQRQHILAETTASISLRDRTKHRPNDGIYLGVSTLDLAFGVCPQAVKLFTGQPVDLQNSANMTANPSQFIVRDFTLEEDYRERPYVAQWPYFRFYAEVPIYSPSGYVLGSLCVVDNKPRGGFAQDDVAALQEISDSISAHLENVRTVRYHGRSDSLVHALTTFVKTRRGHGISSSSSSTVDRHERGGLTSSSPPMSMPDLLAHEQRSVDTEDVSASSDFVSTSPSDSVYASTRKTSLSSRSPETEQFEKPGAEKETHLASTPLVVVKDTVAVSRRISAIFSHASALLRESMHLDGVLFLDASRCNSGIASTPNSTDWEPFPKTVDPKLSHGAPRHLPSPPPSSQTVCDILGSSLEPTSETDSDASSQHAIRMPLLQQLVTAFPLGEVFHIGDEDVATMSENDVEPSIERPRPRRFSLAGGGGDRPLLQPHDRESSLRCQQSAIPLLRRHFPQAKSVVFLPLWDFDKGQWLAGTFIWSRDPERALGLEELHYFRVFSDSIISEVARVNWSREERSKYTFVSSISHELRSPLHGILASSELLLTTCLQPEQQGIVKMLETCGLTLLDTMNHLLDFAKINNLTTLKENSAFHKSAIANLESAFKLDVLLEEVVETMHVGSQHAKTSSEPFPGATVADTATTHTHNHNHRPSVVLRVEEDGDAQWGVQSNTGAWRRILMNILGNALKYTQAGFIEVSLSKIRRPSPDVPGQFVAHLSVTDSGRGMSPDFVRNKSFSPFVQEDHLSEGVGLGLSLVKQLVTLLDGSIDLRSEPGIGTQVDVFIPVQSVVDPSPADAPSATPSSPAPPTRFCLIGFDAYSDLAETPTGTLSSEAKRRLCIQSFFSQLLTNQPGWTVSFADSLEHASGDVAIIEQSTLDDKASDSAVLAKFKRFVVLDNTAMSPVLADLARQAHVIRLSQPYCPKKGLEALREISKSYGLPEARAVEPSPASELAAQESRRQLEVSSPLASLLNSSNKATNGLAHALLPKDRTSTTESVRSDALHVLIIDDNPINVKVLSVFVRKLGWTFDTASNGLIALNKYKEAPTSFDVLLMDISMPVMDGIVATRHIRTFEQEQSLKPVSIMAITGVGSTATRQQALSAGMNNYMIKPLSLQQLKGTLEEVQRVP